MDGVPAMVEQYRRFVSHLKQNVIARVIRRQHLVEKNLVVDCMNT